MLERSRDSAANKGPTKSRSSFEWGYLKRPSDHSGEREEAFRRAIFAIPPGKVSSYGGVAAAAGYPRYHRAVARLLHQDHSDQLPWHRVIGADGEIKTSGASAREQKARLRAEGVSFEGKKVNKEAFLALHRE
jgi:methylated-DNA-protein-cysteine methyltransferase-like protein